jgi:hypothetical protein
MDKRKGSRREPPERGGRVKEKAVLGSQRRAKRKSKKKEVDVDRQSDKKLRDQWYSVLLPIATAILNKQVSRSLPKGTPRPFFIDTEGSCEGVGMDGVDEQVIELTDTPPNLPLILLSHHPHDVDYILKTRMDEWQISENAQFVCALQHGRTLQVLMCLCGLEKLLFCRGIKQLSFFILDKATHKKVKCTRILPEDTGDDSNLLIDSAGRVFTFPHAM